MDKRGELISHKLIILLNIITLIFIISFVGMNNLNINIAKLLIGFSPSILAIIINSLIDKKISESYIYLFVPFISTVLFIVFGMLFLNSVTKYMDFETLSSINFIYTLLFAFIYFFASKKRKKISKRKQVDNIIKREINKEEVKEKKPKKDKKISVNHVIHHRDHNNLMHQQITHSYKKLETKTNINKKDKHSKVERENIYINELKKEFNIININQSSILESLKELADNNKKYNNSKVNIHEILNKFEKDKIFFASNTGEKYHKPLCIVINHIHHDKIIAFKDEKEAIMEGYKPCRVCMPE